MGEHAVDGVAPPVAPFAGGDHRLGKQRADLRVAAGHVVAAPAGRHFVESPGDGPRIIERFGGHVAGQRIVLAVVEQHGHGQVVTGAVGERGVTRQPVFEPVQHALQVRRPLPEVACGRFDVAVHQVAQEGDAVALGRRDADHRHAQRALEGALVHALAPRLGQVHHVEHEQQRPSQLDDLEGQVEVAVEVGRVDDEDDEVGGRRVGLQAEQHVAHDHLVG